MMQVYLIYIGLYNIGVPEEIRTLDPSIKSGMLYQLSYEYICTPDGTRTHDPSIKSGML